MDWNKNSWYVFADELQERLEELDGIDYKCAGGFVLDYEDDTISARLDVDYESFVPDKEWEIQIKSKLTIAADEPSNRFDVYDVSSDVRSFARDFINVL